MEKTFWNTNCSEFERMNERQKPEKTFSRQEPHLICEFIKRKAAVRRSRWRIHRATIERFISVYRLEENGSLLKEGTGDAVGWALRACSYKTKTEASQQRRSRHTLQGVFLVFLCCIPSKWTIIFDDLSHFAIFLSLLEHETPCKCPFGHLLSHIKQQTIGSNFY